MAGFRVDRWLVEKGHAPSRAKAQELIQRGHITLSFSQGRRLKPQKASEAWPEEWGEPLDVEVKSSPLTRYVSRGGWKLSSAIERTHFPIQGRSFLDVGQSTGGFSDVLIQGGARRVVGIDVGQNQLHPRLVGAPNVVALEKVHILKVDPKDILSHNEGEPFEGWVSDVSFISMEKVLPLARDLLGPSSQGLALIKPQFEVGPHQLNKKGLVKSEESFQEVEDKVLRICKNLGYRVLSYFPCEVQGGDGNQEFFLHFGLDDGATSVHPGVGVRTVSPSDEN